MPDKATVQRQLDRLKPVYQEASRKYRLAHEDYAALVRKQLDAEHAIGDASYKISQEKRKIAQLRQSLKTGDERRKATAQRALPYFEHLLELNLSIKEKASARLKQAESQKEQALKKMKVARAEYDKLKQQYDTLSGQLRRLR